MSPLDNRHGLQLGRRGVTLLELIAVVVIIGLIASVTAVGFGKSVVNAKRRQSVETFHFVDQQCRTLADRSNQLVTLQYDINRKQLSRRVGTDDEWLSLAVDVEIPEVWVANSAEGNGGIRARDERDAQTRISNSLGASQIQIMFYNNGSSDTYAIVAHDTSCDLVVGTTGQVVAMPSLSRAKELLDGI